MTGSAVVEELALPVLIERQSRTIPDKTYLQEVGGGLQTYADTHRLAVAWAQVLCDLGVKTGDLVVTMMSPCMQGVNIWLGLGWCRATNVPLNTEFRGEFLRQVIVDSRTALVVCEDQFLKDVLDVLDELVSPRVVVVPSAASHDEELPDGVLNGRSLLAAAENDARPPMFDRPRPQDTATVMYTSGTSGRSKGVLASWASFSIQGRAMLPPGEVLGPEDRMYSYLPIYHVGGTYWLSGLAQIGASMVMRRSFSTGEFWADVRRYRCTVTFLLGAAAQFLLRREQRPDDADNPLKYAEIQPLPIEIEAFEKRFGVSVYTVYGSTETGVVMRSAFDRVDNRSCGRPFSDVEVRIVDQFDCEVPPGEVGELIVRHRRPWAITSGYLNLPEATVRSWRNLWFHTGDALRVDDHGNYFFVDRVNDSIRRRGQNISSFEIERFVNRFEGVLESAAVAVPSELSESEVKICVVAQPGTTLSAPSLIAFLIEERMPRFMIPRFVEIVEALPKTRTGKLQKQHIARDHVNAWDRLNQESSEYQEA